MEGVRSGGASIAVWQREALGKMAVVLVVQRGGGVV